VPLDPTADPKRLVEDGYDRIAETYAGWAGRSTSDERTRYADILLRGLPSGARVLELGCGAGVPVTQALARRFAVTAVDISARQAALARRNAPTATVLHADMAGLAFPPESFDGVIALYSIIHLPRAEHAPLLRAIATWLRPGGLLIATMGVNDTAAGTEEDWLGAPMFWSGFDSATNQGLVRDAGLRIVSAREEAVDEDGQPVLFLWIVAEKPRLAPAP
jgi:SAM-dependent methyltransferase